jgi:hypothetical protein
MPFLQEEREASNLIRKQVVMKKQILKERNLEIVVEAANLEDLEETLVADPRGNLTPSQIVDQRLVTLLQTSHPGCWSRGLLNRALQGLRSVPDNSNSPKAGINLGSARGESCIITQEDSGQYTKATSMSEAMLKLRQLEQDILATGKLDGLHLEALRRDLYADGSIDRRGADFLVELHKRVQRLTPAFEQFFYHAIKSHLLADGCIDAEEAAWLRQMLFATARLDDAERKLLHELAGEAKQVCPEFEALFDECMKQPREQHTSG